MAIVAALALLGACAHAPTERSATYRCDSGRGLDVVYRGADTAIVQMGPRQIVMRRSTGQLLGRRYVGDRLQWVVQTRGEARTGTLFTRGYDDGPGEIAERCHQIHGDHAG